jgi:hypothetical protein
MEQTMSRGHGKWERAILETLERVPAFYLTDLLPDPHTRSQTVALNRAARKLLNAGKLAVKSWWAQDHDSRGYLTIFRVNWPEPERGDITRLKSCTRANNGQHATFTKGPRRSAILDDVEWHRVEEEFKRAEEEFKQAAEAMKSDAP